MPSITFLAFECAQLFAVRLFFFFGVLSYSMIVEILPFHESLGAYVARKLGVLVAVLLGLCGSLFASLMLIYLVLGQISFVCENTIAEWTEILAHFIFSNDFSMIC